MLSNSRVTERSEEVNADEVAADALEHAQTVVCFANALVEKDDEFVEQFE